MVDHAKMSANEVYVVMVVVASAAATVVTWSTQKLDELLTILIQNLCERGEETERRKKNVATITAKRGSHALIFLHSPNECEVKLLPQHTVFDDYWLARRVWRL